jgi:hypothetical protein
MIGMTRRQRPWLDRAARLGGEARAKRLTREERAAIAAAGGKARAARLSKRERRAMGKKMAAARWRKRRAKP